MLTAVLLGFLLGLRHASDPDHVIAVSTIVSRHRRARAAALVGGAWGLGHSATIVAVGAVIIAMRLAVPERVVLGLELVVGVVLVSLGVANLRAASRQAAIEGGRHTHLHDDGGETLRVAARAFSVGLVHGLAGSAAVALLALAAMPTTALAVTYLAVFSLGTIGGMVAISLGIGVPVSLAAGAPHARRWIVAGSGALSVGVGAWMVWGIGNGLMR